MTRTRRAARLSAAVRAAAALAGALAALGHPQVAGAEEPAGPPMSNEMRAERLFRAGEKKFDKGQYAEACADFEASLKITPKLGTLLNLALCHETVGRVATAWREFQHASAWASQNNQRDRHDFAVQHVLALEARLPRVALQLPVDRAVAALEVDGEPLPEQRWNLPVFLDPGEHSVAVSAPGKRRATVTFRVTTSPTEQIVVVPSLDDAPAVPPATPAPPPPRDDGASQRLVGWGLVVGAGAAVVVGAVFTGLTVAKRGDAADRCADALGCDAGGAELWRDAQARATVATVGFAVSAVLGGVGGVLLLTSPRSAAPASRARVGLSPLSGGAALGVSGAF